MQKLPKGYYAVSIDEDALSRGEFTFRGVTYAVTGGENCFKTLTEAAVRTWIRWRSWWPTSRATRL